MFAPAFFGTPLAGILTAAVLRRLQLKRAAVLTLLATVIYIAGAFVPTLLVNVPMNETLAIVTIPADPQAVNRLWLEYSVSWTRWNTLRTLFSFASLLLVGSAIYVDARR